MKKSAKHRKRPKAAKKPAYSPASKPRGGRRPVFSEADRHNYMQMRPAWRVSRLEEVGPFGWHRITGVKIAEVSAKLKSFETMLWSAILVTAKKQNHTIPVENLSKPAKQRLVDIKLDDRDELISLRLSNRERIWGFLEGSTFHLVWWDPEHQVCPSALKHT